MNQKWQGGGAQCISTRFCTIVLATFLLVLCIRSRDECEGSLLRGKQSGKNARRKVDISPREVRRAGCLKSADRESHETCVFLFFSGRWGRSIREGLRVGAARHLCSSCMAL